MSKEELTAVLGGWEGYTLGTVGRVEADQDGRTRSEVHLELLPLREHPRTCSGCVRSRHSIHDTAERWVDDLPILGADTRTTCSTSWPSTGGRWWTASAWTRPTA